MESYSVVFLVSRILYSSSSSCENRLNLPVKCPRSLRVSEFPCLSLRQYRLLSPLGPGLPSTSSKLSEQRLLSSFPTFLGSSRRPWWALRDVEYQSSSLASSSLPGIQLCS